MFWSCPIIERALSILSRLLNKRTNQTTRGLQFGFSSTIHPLPFICLLGHSQVGQLRGHDAARARARNDAVFGKVGDAAVLAEEVLVEDQLAVDLCGGGAQDGKDGVGEDGGFAEVFFLVGVFLCELLGGGGFDGLDDGGLSLVCYRISSWCCRYTHHCGPDARNGHVLEPLALKVNGQALCQDAHADLAHGVGGLAAEEAAVDGRADDDDAALLRVAEVRQRGLDDGVEALWVDALHELEALERRVCD